MNKIFVYGTLMSGHLANMMLETSDFIANGITEQPYVMKSNDVFSSLDVSTKENEKYSGNVMGEIYDITDNMLSTIDEYLSLGTLTYRWRVTISTCENETITCWMYMQKENQKNAKLHNEYVIPYNNVLNWDTAQ